MKPLFLALLLTTISISANAQHFTTQQQFMENVVERCNMRMSQPKHECLGSEAAAVNSIMEFEEAITAQGVYTRIIRPHCYSWAEEQSSPRIIDSTILLDCIIDEVTAYMDISVNYSDSVMTYIEGVRNGVYSGSYAMAFASYKLR